MEEGSVAIALHRLEVGFNNVQRSNQFDHFSELGKHEKSRRGICGIRSRDLTRDHFPKAVVQGIRRGRGKCHYCLTQGVGRISKVSIDLINSISCLSQVNKNSRVVVYVVYGVCASA